MKNTKAYDLLFNADFCLKSEGQEFRNSITIQEVIKEDLRDKEYPKFTKKSVLK